MNQKGMTFVELMVAMAIVGILMCQSDGMVSAATRYQAIAVRTELAAELRAARHLAMMKREKVRVVFEPSLPSIRTELMAAPYTILRTYSFGSSGVTVESVSSGPAVTFYPSGRAATPTTITLQHSRGGRWRMTVTITGRVNI